MCGWLCAEQVLKGNSKPFTHVAVIHSETTSGILNDVETIGKVNARCVLCVVRCAPDLPHLLCCEWWSVVW
jgi:hypothetical protein